MTFSRIAAACLFAAVIFIYLPTTGYGFVNLDDDVFFYENAHVLSGLSAESIQWAFTAQRPNWQPLVWLSHMTSATFFGTGPGAQHTVNFVLHALNAVLLFLVLRQLVADPWVSLLAAALFAVHPLRVESVAWIAERKDVLSGFWLLAIWFHIRGRRWGVILAFVAGLMAKPSVMTLPVVLLLLDYWPLRRFEKLSPRALIIEKLPLLALSCASFAITLYGQMHAGAVASTTPAALPLRLQTVLNGYLQYLLSTVWPTGLAIIYPYPDSYPPARLLFAAAVLAGLSWLAWRQRLVRPWLVTGWLWYLVTLVPNIGFLQVGPQPYADRYTYLPMTMFSLTLVLAGRDLLAAVGVSARNAAALGLAVCLVLAAAARAQTAYWSDSITAYRHAVDVTGGSAQVHANLGAALADLDRRDEAIPHLETALRINPKYANAAATLGIALLFKNQPAQALPHLQSALDQLPDSAKVNYQTARALSALNRPSEAIPLFRRAAQLGIPEKFQAAFQLDLGAALMNAGDFSAALAAFQEAMRLAPQYVPVHRSAAAALIRLGRRAEATQELSVYIAGNPSDQEAQNVLRSLQEPR